VSGTVCSRAFATNGSMTRCSEWEFVLWSLIRTFKKSRSIQLLIHSTRNYYS